MNENKKDFGVRNIAFIGMSVALITICSWISIPSTIPFTLQTFAIFLSVLVLGWRDSLIAIATYLILGTIGVPVFSNFNSGIGAIMGPTGGYLIGFLFLPIVSFVFSLIRQNALLKIIGLVVALILCYLFGTIWFTYVYNNMNGDITILKAFSICVLPFIIPDVVKLSLAFFISSRLERIMNGKTQIDEDKTEHS